MAMKWLLSIPFLGTRKPMILRFAAVVALQLKLNIELSGNISCDRAPGTVQYCFGNGSQQTSERNQLLTGTELKPFLGD